MRLPLRIRTKPGDERRVATTVPGGRRIGTILARSQLVGGYIDAPPPLPVFTSPGNFSVVLGSMASFQVVATNATSYAATGLPGGLTMDAFGLITGDWTGAAPGDVVVTITATGPGGSSAQALTISLLFGLP